MFYKELQKKILDLVEKNHLTDTEISITTHVLKPTEAIGNPDRTDFPLLKGKEALMQAEFMGVKGQAYTDAPSQYMGPLSDILNITFENTRQTALFVAALNAVMRYLYPEIKTIHCKNNEPEECAQEIAATIQRYNSSTIGMIGLQPAILEAVGKTFGRENVACLDRDEENREQVKYGVRIEWGDHEAMEKLFRERDLILATGSTLANRSLPEILELSGRYDTPVYFYGTTIAGTARLMGLNHVCFRST